ncbi:phosphatidate cytidylyltransferase [Caryophanon latum]|uniref:Phosphatidate cytidylyltransferase n=1 Tax=Caryophanon latum TaxID=33977 RepID=A0A1C0YZ34_9BACL|nr:phosphatidate cytidylyltransferase [Caryophanon latum]OCS92356.1 phosphatidate cytidylyltransferase [Caryophanon latum]
MKTRMITGVVAAALFIPFVLYGGLPWSILVYALAAISMYELLKMKDISIFSAPGVMGTLALFVLLLPTQWAVKLQEWTTYDKLELLFLVVLALLVYSVVVKNKFTFDGIGFIIMSAMYVGLGFHYFIEARAEGVVYLIFAFVVVWTTDSGAYFTGRKFGKRKLWPHISPNKTVEGFVGGIVIAIIAAVIMELIYPFAPSWTMLIIVTIICSIFGQIGDLVESAIKRHYNVKDSGRILPGHGGILDRFDSLLFVIPLLHFLHFM